MGREQEKSVRGESGGERVGAQGPGDGERAELIARLAAEIAARDRALLDRLK